MQVALLIVLSLFNQLNKVSLNLDEVGLSWLGGLVWVFLLFLLFVFKLFIFKLLELFNLLDLLTLLALLALLALLTLLTLLALLEPKDIMRDLNFPPIIFNFN